MVFSSSTAQGCSLYVPHRCCKTVSAALSLSKFCRRADAIVAVDKRSNLSKALLLPRKRLTGRRIVFLAGREGW